MTLSVRRSIAALALGAALVSAGCAVNRAETAAVVDGNVITERDLQRTISELNQLEPTPFQGPLTPSTTLTFMVQAPFAIDLLESKGVIVSESVATGITSRLGVANPSDATVDVIRSLAAQSAASASGQWAGAEVDALAEQVKALEVTVNPRYGSLVPASAQIQLTAPDWVKAVAEAPAP